MKSKKKGTNLARVNHVKQVSEGKTNSEIINSLNPDCWRLILDYLTVKELLQSEATCKDWQKMVLNHISYRPLLVTEDDSDVDEMNTLILRTSSKSCASFRRWVKKCGHAVQEFDMDCLYFRDVVEVLRENCPNLKYIKLKRLKNKLPPTKTQHFHKLTWLVFECCDEVTDDCVSQFLNTDTKELVLIYNKRVTGRFLNNLKSDAMKRLVIRHCRAFKFQFLLSSDRLRNLGLLIFWKKNRSKIAIRDKLHLLLEKMPNLHEIGLEVYDMMTYGYEEDRVGESNVFFESVCRLKKLFALKANVEVWDHHLEAVASSCKELAAIDLVSNNVTRRGVDALCRHAGTRLYQLHLPESLLTDDDVVACVYQCPNLLYLDLYNCPLLTRSAVHRIAVARRDLRENATSKQLFQRLGLRLQLTVNRLDFGGAGEDYKDVIDIRFPGEVDSDEHLY